MAKSEKLTDEVKTYVVQALACFDSPSTVAKAVKDDFAIEVTRQTIESYDPTKRAGRDVALKWRGIFEASRAAFLANTAEIGVSHRAVRLRKLDRMATDAERMRNFGLAAQLLEQAAKEVGNAYTNKRELTGPDGGAIITDQTLRIELIKPAWKVADAEHPSPGSV